MNRILFSVLLFINISAFGQTFQRYKTPKDTVFSSKYLKYDKEISIILPREYQQNLPNKFPLIVVFDSQNKMSYNYILQTIDYLTSNSAMPACVVVGIKSNQNKRVRETQPKINDSTAFGEKNEQFIFDELMPFLKSNYKTNGFNTLIGHSRYGFFTTYLMTKRPNEINAVIALSPFFDEKNVNLVDSVKNKFINKKLSNKLYYRFGIGNDFVADLKAMQEVLKLQTTNGFSADFNVKAYSFLHADHYTTPGLIISQALYEIFEFWGEKSDAYQKYDKKVVEDFDKLNTTIQQHYGAPIPVSINILNGKAQEFRDKGEYQQALKTFELLLKNYPNFSEIHLQIAKTQKLLKIPFEKSLKDFEVNLSKSIFYTVAEKQELLLELEEFRKSK